MSGTNAGTGQPITLKCSKCKLSRNVHGNARMGLLVRTGRKRTHKTSKPGPRMGRVAYECQCVLCDHVGWYRHKDVTRADRVLGPL